MPVWNEDPMMSAVVSSTTGENVFVTTSDSVRPPSTAGRAMGSERKRSISPFEVLREPDRRDEPLRTRCSGR